MTILDPLPPEHFDAFAEASIASHAADSVASGRCPAHEAVRLAREEFERLLPQRTATADHRFYEIKEDATGPVAGFVWLGSLPRGGTRVAFVFQIYVHPPFRRRGHARAALTRVEALAGDMGVSGIALNVAGSNAAAQALYRSLGYRVTNMSLHKPLRPTASPTAEARA